MNPRGSDAVTPNAKAIRDALRSALYSRHLTSSLVIEELGICRGQVRVDLVVVDDLLHGYEIKSDRDNLRRLARQVAHYSNVLDRATLVIGERHFTEAIDYLPSWWGITRFSIEGSRTVFQSIRETRPNPSRVPRALVEFLWRDEVLALLKERDLDIGVRSKARRELWDRVCSSFDLEEIAGAVKKRLMARADAIALLSPS